MSKKDISSVKAMAVIDIGSNDLRLRIAENSKGKMKFIESLSYPLSLGRDTFNNGKISYERVDKACGIIQNFLTVAKKEYGAVDCRTVATTAVREATNRDYILDQIKIKTGVNVEVIDDAQEKLYIYKLMAYLIDPKLRDSAIMVYTGSGNIGISLWKNGEIPFIQSIQIGSLRISELFEDIQEYSSQFYVVVEEYLDSFTETLETYLTGEVKNFIASGQEISMIADLTGAKRDTIFLEIERGKFNALFEEIKYKSVERISDDYCLPEEKAEVLLPAMCTYKNLLEFTRADKIVTPLVLLSDALMFEMLYPQAFVEISRCFDKSAIVTAENIAKRFNAVQGHYELVSRYALKIFDKMKKIHGMGKREKLLLQSAGILHDVGKFINVKQHYWHSYNIIKGLDITGLSFLETEIVAQISLYHSRITPEREHEGFSALDMNNRVLVSKLSAILRLADSLDRSHEQKFDDIDVKITDDAIVITIMSDKNVDLEVWAFNDKSVFFQEVFGIKAVIRKKRVV